MRVATALSTALRESGYLPRRAWPRLRAARPLTNELRQRISHRVADSGAAARGDQDRC